MESFWSTEYGQNILSVEQTEIDKLLTAPSSATLEDLFDEDELLQQCSNKNTQLISFLSQQENITKLVSYITRPWQEHMTQIINHLKEQEELNKNNVNKTKSNAPSSPLSKNGLHRVTSIEEEPANQPDPLSLTDDTLMTLPDQADPQPDQPEIDEFNHYDELKLSDDDEEDAKECEESDVKECAPPLKKKGSIVDMLMAGPEFSDDTELHDDPELPEEEEIPPPPPPPACVSKLEEFESEVGMERVKLKYPYLASEIINCQIPAILDSILNESAPFLDMLFDFIQQHPPLNAVLTNYWRSCVVGLVRRNSSVILKYIRTRKNLLSWLVSHIRDQSIMELVIALGWDPAIEELKELDEVADWMNEEELVPKLIATLAPNRTPDEHSAASYTLVDIVAKTSRSTNLVLFYNLASETQIAALMNHMFAGNRSSLLESLSVLLALLHHYPNVSAEKQQFGDEYREEPPPPPPQEMNANPLAIAPPQSETKQEEEEEECDEFIDSIPAVVRAVCCRLGDFKILLETAPSQSLKLPFVELAPPLGPVRHKVVDMIVALMRTPSDVVSLKLRSLGLIVQCIDLFFLYPWNNLLHGSVEHIIQMVVSGDCSILKKALFEDCDFLNRILSARQLSATHQETQSFRLGYMGHITRVSNTIVEFAKRNQQLLDYMESNKEWMKFIADDLKLENEQLNTQLGGHRPSALNGDDADNDAFTLFTLNDINTDNSAPIEEDHDSDSDSDEQIEMPQEAFNKLTQNIDKKKDDFDEWFNDADSWNDFDKKKPSDHEEIQPTKDATQINEDFDKWDTDPFADDLLCNNNQINGHDDTTVTNDD
eukprot:171006_1